MNQTSPYTVLFNFADVQLSKYLDDNPGEHSHCVYSGTGQGIEALGLWSQTGMESIPDIYNKIT